MQEERKAYTGREREGEFKQGCRPRASMVACSLKFCKLKCLF